MPSYMMEIEVDDDCRKCPFSRKQGDWYCSYAIFADVDFSYMSFLDEEVDADGFVTRVIRPDWCQLGKAGGSTTRKCGSTGAFEGKERVMSDSTFEEKTRDALVECSNWLLDNADQIAAAIKEGCTHWEVSFDWDNVSDTANGGVPQIHVRIDRLDRKIINTFLSALKA